jgi:hypothetical protein
MRCFWWLGWVLAAACALPLRAQEPDDVQERLRKMEERLRAVESDNASLRTQVQRVTDENVALRGDAQTALTVSQLEQRIESLRGEMAQDSGTRVKSVASPITITGEFRFRYAASFGDNAAGTTPPGVAAGFGAKDDEHDGTWGDQLTRVGLRYDFESRVSAYSEFRAHTGFGKATSTSFPFGIGATTFGSPTGQSSTDIGEAQTFLFIYQTWIEIRELFGLEELSSRTGRQEIVLGNRFQFGNSEWFSGLSFDGTRFDYASEDWGLTALVFKLQSIDGDEDQVTSFFNSHDDDALFALYLQMRAWEPVNLDLYWIFVNGHGGARDNGAGSSVGALGNFVGSPRNDPGNFTTNGTAYYHTLGARLFGTIEGIAGGLDWQVEGAYQIGSQGNAFGQDFDIAAGTVEVELGLVLCEECALRVFTRFLYASGPDGDELAYTPLYPDRHLNSGYRARYGLWDLIPMSNVVTAQLGMHFDPSASWTVGATGLWATTDEDGIMPSTRRNGFARNVAVPDEDYGFEADLWGEYRFSNQLTVGGGLGFFFADEAGEAQWSIDDGVQFLAYLQMRLVF